MKNWKDNFEKMIYKFETMFYTCDVEKTKEFIKSLLKEQKEEHNDYCDQLVLQHNSVLERQEDHFATQLIEQKANIIKEVEEQKAIHTQLSEEIIGEDHHKEYVRLLTLLKNSIEAL